MRKTQRKRKRGRARKGRINVLHNFLTPPPLSETKMSDMTQVYLEVGKLSKVDFDIRLLDLVASAHHKDKQYQQVLPSKVACDWSTTCNQPLEA